MRDAYLLPALLLVALIAVPFGGNLWLPGVLGVLLTLDLAVTALRR